MEADQIHWITEMIIEDGKLDTFKELAGGLVEAVHETEPDTLVYDYHIREDGSKCFVNELYADTEAALTHMNGKAGEYIPQILEIADINTMILLSQVENQELRDGLKQFDAQFTEFYQGFSR
ncbi:MAG TPA: antibiotic biosynthesis monooxygenase [bacterium]|nr:antibiotic biosynthesis monooxygenase [bacterium]